MENRNVDIVLSNGAEVEIKMGRDENEAQVIQKLVISFPKGLKIPQGGITIRTLREIRIQDILEQRFERFPTSELSSLHKKKLIKYLQREFSSSRATYSELFYASLSVLYVNLMHSDPTSPTSKMSELLDIPKRTVVNRIGKARTLGMLSQQSVDKPSGKAGGNSSLLAQLLVNDFLNGKVEDERN